MDPLVVTLAIDERAQRRFDAERRRFFPPERLLVGAHVTLFHAVPGTLHEQVDADLGAVTARSGFAVSVTEVISLGAGTAYRLQSDDLQGIHRQLQVAWWHQLSKQDQQRLRPHVTVQNKVTRDQSRATTLQLQAVFESFDVRAEGIVLWRYTNGRWQLITRYDFN